MSELSLAVLNMKCFPFLLTRYKRDVEVSLTSTKSVYELSAAHSDVTYKAESPSILVVLFVFYCLLAFTVWQAKYNHYFCR